MLHGSIRDPTHGRRGRGSLIGKQEKQTKHAGCNRTNKGSYRAPPTFPVAPRGGAQSAGVTPRAKGPGLPGELQQREQHAKGAAPPSGKRTPTPTATPAALRSSAPERPAVGNATSFCGGSQAPSPLLAAACRGAPSAGEAGGTWGWRRGEQSGGEFFATLSERGGVPPVVRVAPRWEAPHTEATPFGDAPGRSAGQAAEPGANGAADPAVALGVARPERRRAGALPHGESLWQPGPCGRVTATCAGGERPGGAEGTPMPPRGFGSPAPGGLGPEAPPSREGRLVRGMPLGCCKGSTEAKPPPL